MSTDVTHTQDYQSICGFNPQNSNVAKSDRTDQAIKNISSVVSSFISHIQTTDNEINVESIATFSEKVGLINSQFDDEGKGTPFSVALYTLDLISNLRNALPPEKHDILKHPLLTQLKMLSEQDSIEDQLGTARQIALFQRDVLCPAIIEAESPEELAALRPIVKLIIEIKPKVDAVDAKGVLNRLATMLREAYNYKHISLSPLYSFLTSYEAGSIAQLDSPERRNAVFTKLTELQQNIARIAEEPHMSTDDKVAIYHAYLQIQTELGEHGHLLDEAIDALETTFGLHKGIKSGFTLELKQFTTDPITGELGPIAAKLTAFETDHLIPALQRITTREELLALKPLVDQCIKLKPLVIQADAGQRLDQANDTMIGLYNAKLRKTHKLFPRLIAYERGNVGDLSSTDRRGQIATILDNYINETIDSFEHPLFTPEEKTALYKAILTIQKELEEYQDGNLLEPTVRALRTALNIAEPKPQRSQRNNLFSLWESRSKGSQDSTPVATPIVRKREEVSGEVRQARSLQAIQEKVASLDLQSQFLGTEIQDIKQHIRTLRTLSGDPTQFAHLEKALDALLNPAPFQVSKEENVFIALLGEKCKLREEQIQDYQAQEKPTVLEAQSTLLKELKRNAGRPERLEAAAGEALIRIPATAKETRFRRFTDLHTLNPALNQNFQAHYPALVQTFELFTRETLTNSLEAAWMRIERLFDGDSEGKFSQLLAHYSYTDPRQQFHIYSYDCQEDFFNALDLRAIDRTPLGQLQPYLEQKVEEHKTNGAETFQRNYIGHFQSEHFWLFDNVDKVTMPHNQGDNDNTNLGKGACYNNCLSRMSALMQNPTMDRSTLQMGSTEQTRFYHNLVRRKVEKAQDGAMSWDEASLAIKKNCEVYGLKHHYMHNVSTNGNLYENLATDMQKFSTVGYKQVILGLRDPETGGGHAVNLIFDNARGIYSIEDDNLGRVDFASLNELQTQGSDYFKIFYPNNTTLSFECYRL